MAGGWILACACDYRVVAAGQGKVGTPELQVGVAFPPIALETVRFATPAAQLSAVVLLGRTFDGDEALRAGLAEEALPPAAVLSRALAVAQSLAQIPAEAFRLTKAQLRAPFATRAEQARDTAAAVRAQWRDGNTAAVIGAYLERVVGKRS
jgi:enoyl-CoA hydratase